jgi:iron-sulfur cluster assembly accessory protein
MKALIPLPETKQELRLTSNAAKRILKILSAEPKGSYVRLRVDGGGCSGFQYHFDITSLGEEDDIILETDGAVLRVDRVSLPLIEGSVIDFVDDLMGQSFRVTNPGATASCGCGTSFSL